ncbi:hypothetical protein [Pseudoalteromonas maricaloris]|uniref:DUF2335 domain-containing protein n=1 Tax=Pseudoalteromonas maricaloris TaxID=184924 RepID=A0ABZ0M922_9GAMM|nr:hypothetical protein [Pseudoalteromonas maricaloris]WOX28303.1 hypothetical protein R5H13_16995 [Pseudoalteromonas maricaloris]
MKENKVRSNQETESASNMEHEKESVDSIERVLERVAEKDPQAAVVISEFIAVQQVSHKGPMPSPEDLKKYSHTLKNLPDRMMKMAELSQQKKAAHHERILELKSEEIDVQRLEVEQANDAHKRETATQVLGMVFAFITVIICILGAFYLALQDKTEVALVIGGTTVIGIVGAFLKTKLSEKKTS